MLDWTQEDLATAAGVCRSTVREFEKGRHTLQRSSEEALLNALKAAGAEVLPESRHGLGVRLRPEQGPAD